MKKRIIFSGIAIAFTCLALTSCDWFTKDKTEKQPTLIGKWVLVNIADSSKDSSNHAIALLAIGMALNDSAKITVEFKSDSSFIMKNDTSSYYIDSTLQTLFIKEGATNLLLTIKQQTDSSLQLFSAKDSLMYTLQKMK